MRKLLLVVASMLLLASSLLAQNQHTIKGKVTDEAGNALPGVSVSLPGGKTGTVTNTKGEFSLSVPNDIKTLKISFVGYEAQSLPVKGNDMGSIKLTADTKAISEVVVVGYGTQRKKDVTANIASVKGTAVAQLPVPSFDAGLGGRAAGVQITVPNGVVNNPPVFRVRGSNSISMSAYPLIVIDGVPTFSGDAGSSNAPFNPLASLNPADIESIDVLKDASATAIYGSRAANGVVLVTTKKGKAGRLKVSYDGWVGLTSPTRLPKMLNAREYIALKNEALVNAKRKPVYELNTDAKGDTIDTDWFDVVYRKRAVSQSHSVNVSGGTENTSYYLSAGYTRQEGILKRNDFSRKNLLFNLDQKLGKIVSIGAKLAYSNELSRISSSSGSLEGEAFNSGGLARLAFVTSPIVAPFNNDGSYNIGSTYIAGGKNGVRTGLYNPQVLLDLDHSNTEGNHAQGNIYLQVRPWEWLTLRTQYGIDYLTLNNDVYANNLHGDAQTSNGESTETFLQYKRWVWTNTAQLEHAFGKHRVTLLLGNEQQRDTRHRYGIDRQGQSDNYFNNGAGGWQRDVSSGMLRSENYLLSAFARANYSYQDKYYLNANVRQDQYSAFGPDKKKGIFYSFAAGWEIARENFWADGALGRIFSSFKLRGSYGQVGNAAGLGDFDALSLYYPTMYGENTSALYYGQAGNPLLNWETSKKTDIGFSYGLLNNRITGELSYYYNNIDGLILYVKQAPSAGLPTTIPTNIGRMYNRGVEFAVNAVAIDKKDFSWNTSFNIAFNKNEVTNLGADNLIPFSTGTLEQTSVNQVGYPASMIMAVRTNGVDPATGRRIFVNKAGENVYYDPVNGSYTYADGKPAPAVGVKDAVAYKNTNPKVLGGFENTFRYKAFELNVLLTYQTGFYVYYGSNAGLLDQRFWNNSKEVLNRWQKQGDVTDIPKVVFGDNVSNGSTMALSSNVFKGDFLKLRSVGLTYTVPSKVAAAAHLAGARVYVRGQNLAVWTKYPGPDPEVSSNGNNASGQGVDRNTLANGRTFTVGVNLNF
ncbi:SusC/RagA family TonB-linked outer membrane protein [Chitinophaga nivalis]|uniref:TonB-dependent receptor n=1 Tax=Chitinophaga nivalis TaxID=2991709 RepID=A0ABT3ISE5_9BACT|nr:TonB-dependent receptor [Chitinophaga nivalis]MCW3463427.1 TonB-dependent receptor [Chitinophaga nivalis]MCW3486883.1 TonB-dependent receptor [Chitinophaga nivalis]